MNVWDNIANEITAVSVSPSKCCAVITVMAILHNRLSGIVGQTAGGGRRSKGWKEIFRCKGASGCIMHG